MLGAVIKVIGPKWNQGRLTHMTDIHDEGDFDASTAKFDALKLSAQIKVPYLVIAGEDDELSDIGYTFEHLKPRARAEDAGAL